MRIAIDAMGGDDAPAAVVAGALSAAKKFPQIETLILVGDRERIEKELPPERNRPSSIVIHHASEIVDMGESPAVAIRKKRILP